MAQRPVTLADIVRGHVSLEIEGFDRLYFNGWVPALQTSGQIAGWLHWRGSLPIASPAALGRDSQAFRAAVRRYADGNQIPWVVFRKGDRKLDVIRPYLDAAEKAGQSKVVAIGEAREFQWVFDATKKDGPDGVPWFKFYRTERLVTCYYFYIHDRRIGAAFIKVCCYAPYPVKVWCNGHEIARRAALAEGIAVTPLANGFAATSDPARLQELCDLVQVGTVRVFFETWMSRLPLPLTGADREHDCWWQLAMRQVEVSRTLVFDDPRRVRTVFEELLRRQHQPGPARARGGHLRLQGHPPHAGHLLHPAAQPRRPGHHQPELPAFAGQDLPEGGPRAESGDRHQRPRRPGLQARPGAPGRTGGQSACMQRPADGCCSCRPGQRHPRESSHRADRAPHHRRGGAEGPGHALRGPPGAGPGRLPGPSGTSPSTASRTRASVPG